MTDQRRPLLAREPPTAEELEEADRIVAMAGTELKTARIFAERWRNAGIVSGAVVLAAGLIAGPDALDGVTASTRTVVVFLFCAASFVGIISVATSIRASLGWPKLIDNSSPLAFKKWEYKEATLVLSLLRWSMISSVVVALTMLVAVAIVFGAERTSGFILVTNDRGKTLCATSIEFDGTALRAEVNGAWIALKAEEIGSYTRSSAC